MLLFRDIVLLKPVLASICRVSTLEAYLTNGLTIATAGTPVEEVTTTTAIVALALVVGEVVAPIVAATTIVATTATTTAAIVVATSSAIAVTTTIRHVGRGSRVTKA